MRRGASAKFKIGQPEKAPPRQSIDNAPVSVDQKLDAAAAQKEAADDAEAARKGLVVAYAKQMKEKKESLEVDEASKQRKAADALAEKARNICTHADIHCSNARMDDDALTSLPWTVRLWVWSLCACVCARTCMPPRRRSGSRLRPRRKLLRRRRQRWGRQGKVPSKRCRSWLPWQPPRKQVF